MVEAVIVPRGRYRQRLGPRVHPATPTHRSYPSSDHSAGRALAASQCESVFVRTSHIGCSQAFLVPLVVCQHALSVAAGSSDPFWPDPCESYVHQHLHVLSSPKPFRGLNDSGEPGSQDDSMSRLAEVLQPCKSSSQSFVGRYFV